MKTIVDKKILHIAKEKNKDVSAKKIKTQRIVAIMTFSPANVFPS